MMHLKPRPPFILSVGHCCHFGVGGVGGGHIVGGGHVDVVVVVSC